MPEHAIEIRRSNTARTSGWSMKEMGGISILPDGDAARVGTPFSRRAGTGKKMKSHCLDSPDACPMRRTGYWHDRESR